MSRNEDERYALSASVVELATQAGLTVGTAESCTGGLVSAALTDVPGSSAAVKGGIVSYAISVKESVLGVSTDITRDDAVGVVSGECARAMSEGARRVLNCDVSVSTTGIAGPGGAEPDKPVGTVWFAVSSERGTRCECHVFEGGRDAVRRQAVVYALRMLQAELQS